MLATSLLTGLLICGQVTPAEEPPPPDFLKSAAEYQIELADRARSPLKLLPQPLLKWTNPARTSERGEVFLWVKDGHPEVIGSMFTYKLSKVFTKHEFQSLATVPLTAKYQGVVAWKPPVAGVRFAPIPEASAPAATERLRTIQLKNLAREFSANLLGPNGEPTELRLMPQALYRYETDGSQILDGAIFSFAVGTDPEALLLLEAQKSDDGWQWQFAFARFHFQQVIARHRDVEVFRVERDANQLNTRLGDPASRDKIYVTYHVD